MHIRYEKEKEDIRGQFTEDITQYKKEIQDFKTRIRRITQEMSRTNYANANILKKMAVETGAGLPKDEQS